MANFAVADIWLRPPVQGSATKTTLVSPPRKGLLVVVEDDLRFTKTLARSFKRRGYEVASTSSHERLSALLKQRRPDFAVVDLNLGSSSGLDCIQMLHANNPAMRIVVVTGYASVATAVEAVKLGALQYLSKPVSADMIERAFQRVHGDATVKIAEQPTSLKSWEWDRISATLAQTGFNISEAARRLNMHRRTLARKLKRHFSGAKGAKTHSCD